MTLPLFPDSPPQRSEGREAFNSKFDEWVYWFTVTFVNWLIAQVLAWGPGTPWCTVGGTANAITLTTGIGLGALNPGQSFRFKATATNTAAVSINPDGLGARTGVDATGVAIGAGYIVAGRIYDATFDGTNIVVAPKIPASAILSTGTLGFSAGAGNSVTQATSKSTSVTLNKSVGIITTAGSSLAALANADFNVNCSHVGARDLVIVNVIGNSAYTAICRSTFAGGFICRITNISGGALSDNPPVMFAVIKGVDA